MEEILARLRELTPEQLREKFATAKLACGPITPTTRKVFERKLARALMEKQAGPGEADGNGTEQAIPQTPDPPEPGKTEEAHETDGTVKDETPSLFYGVSRSPDYSLIRDETPHVYVDMRKAIEATVKMGGTTFKGFCSRAEAEQFSRTFCKHEKPPVNLEKANEFSCPLARDLTGKLKSAVEKGEEETFSQLVCSNPRYLVGSGDNPTIVQFGCRYNVLHVAAKENQPGIAQLILDTLEDPEFMSEMYPHDQEAVLLERISHIVDLYLNMPEEGNNETPLHFACKFGYAEVVDVLCSYPAIDRNIKNNDSQKPEGVICARGNKNKKTEKKIKEHLEACFYVPLLRATDNTLQPVIDGFWSPRLLESSELIFNSGIMASPTDPTMVVSAVVGPLSPSKADAFQKLWKTPPRDRAQYFHDILETDPDRGRERVGRELAHEMGHRWREYWKFLDRYVDLSLKEGLKMLERYLRQKTGLDTTPQECVWSGRMGTYNRQEPGARAGEPEEAPPCPVRNLMEEFDEAPPQDGLISAPVLRGESDDAAASDTHRLAHWASEAADRAVADGSFRRTCDGRPWPDEDQASCSSEDYFSANEEPEGTVNGQRGGATTGSSTPGRRVRSCSESSNTSYESTCSTPEDTGGPPRLFIEGESPTKMDEEVLQALGGKDIEEERYPHIARWKSTILAYPSSERRRWLHTAGINQLAHTPASIPRWCRRSRSMGTPGQPYRSASPHTC